MLTGTLKFFENDFSEVFEKPPGKGFIQELRNTKVLIINML